MAEIVARQLAWRRFRGLGQLPSSPSACRALSFSTRILNSETAGTDGVELHFEKDRLSWLYTSSKVIDIAPLAEDLRRQVRSYTRQNALKLVGILGSTGTLRTDAELYSERIAKTCQEDYIDYELWRCTDHSPETMGDLIAQANKDTSVDGILVYYPVYPADKGPYKNRFQGVYYKTHDDYFRDLVHPSKDVEGLSGTRWYNNPRQKSANTAPLVFPCTARSVQAILEEYHTCFLERTTMVDRLAKDESSTPWQGLTVSIVNRSEILGRPLATMLATSGATVYSIDVDTVLKFQPGGKHTQRCDISLELCLAESNVLVTGVPEENFKITSEHIAEGTTVINVSEYANVDERTLLERADIQYIPQIGKVTIAILEQNLVRLRKDRVSTPA